MMFYDAKTRLQLRNRVFNGRILVDFLSIRLPTAQAGLFQPQMCLLEHIPVKGRIDQTCRLFIRHKPRAFDLFCL